MEICINSLYQIVACLSSGSGRKSKDFCSLPLLTRITMVPTRLSALLQFVALSSWISHHEGVYPMGP